MLERRSPTVPADVPAAFTCEGDFFPQSGCKPTASAILSGAESGRDFFTSSWGTISSSHGSPGRAFSRWIAKEKSWTWVLCQSS